MGKWILSLLLVVLLTAPQQGTAQEKTAISPYFVSLRSNEVNMRTGPGMRYPIDWIYKRRDMPVLVTERYDVWRKITDWEGTSGWIHQRMLSSRRYGLITKESEMKRSSDAQSRIIAILEPNVIVKLISCPRTGTKCRVEAQGKHGFISRSSLWGITEDEGI